MRIGMILDNEFTGDMRVENEVFSLQKAGHEVVVLCFNHGKKAAQEDFHGAKIVRIPLSLWRKNKMKGFQNTPFDLYAPFWARKVVKAVKEYNLQALHAHDLNMFPVAFRANKRLSSSLPVIGDLHENYPAALESYSFTKKFPGKYVVSIPKWRRAEKEWTAKAEHIITVIEEATERYTAMGLPKEKISVVANYVNPDLFLETAFDEDLIQKFQKRFVLSYVGGFDIHRGLEVVIKAMPKVKEAIPNALLLLVGAGRNLEELKTLAQQLGIENNIEFAGWQKPSRIPSFLKASDITLIPHLKTEHTDHTIPHKLFQYMLLEKPVVVANCRPLERIVKETGAGMAYTHNDPNDLAQQLISLHADPKRLALMGQKGKQAVESTYNWDQTAATLVYLYNQLEKKLA